MKKSLCLLSVLFFLSCGGGSKGTSVILTWSKVSTPCVNAEGGGYKIYYFTSQTDLGADINVSEFDNEHTSIQVAYSSLTDPNTPSTTLRLRRGYTYFKVSSYCSNQESVPSIYTFVVVE